MDPVGKPRTKRLGPDKIQVIERTWWMKLKALGCQDPYTRKIEVSAR